MKSAPSGKVASPRASPRAFRRTFRRTGPGRDEAPAGMPPTPVRTPAPGPVGGRRRGRPPASYRVLRAAVLGLLLIGVSLCWAVGWDSYATRTVVYPGVHLLGIPLGNETPLDAMSRVSAATGGGSLASYRFTASTSQDRTPGVERFRFRSGDLGVNFDVRGSVNRAYRVGRSGTPWRRLRERASARLSGRYPVEPDLSYDADRAGQAVGKIAAKINRKPSDARIEISGGSATLVPHRAGLKVDRDGTLSNLSLALSTLNSEVAVALDRPLPDVLTSGAKEAHELAQDILSAPVVLEADLPKGVGPRRTTRIPAARTGEAIRIEKVPAREGPFSGRLDLSVDARELAPEAEAFLTTLNKQPEDAWLRFVPGDGASVEVVPSRDGSKAAETTPAVLDEISQGLLSGDHDFKVKTERVRPDRTTRQTEAVKPVDPLARQSISFEGGASDASRTQNIALAVGALDGTLLAPGESLSVLDHISGLAFSPTDPVSDPTSDPVTDPAAGESGSNPGRPPVDDAGGLSQVSTALYDAALKSGLTVTERSPSPEAPLPYVDGNLEAYVSPGGGEDLVIGNTRDEYLLVRAQSSSDGTVEVTLYGRPSDSDPDTELQADLQSVEKADGTIRETWRSEKVVPEGAETLGEQTYSYPDPSPPPPPKEPADNAQKENPDKSTEDEAEKPPPDDSSRPESTTPADETSPPERDAAPPSGQKEPSPEESPPPDGGNPAEPPPDAAVPADPNSDNPEPPADPADSALPGSDNDGYP